MGKPDFKSLMLCANTTAHVLTGYLVEQRASGRATWERLGYAEGDLEWKAPGLTPGQNYLFRVAAENQVGLGEFVEMTKGVTAKSQFGALVGIKVCLWC